MTMTASTDNPLVIRADGTYFLGGIGRGLGITALGFTGTGWTGNIKMYGMPRGGLEAELKQIDYFPRNLNGSPSDSSPVSTTITTDSLIQVDASAMDIAIVVSGYSAGSMSVRKAKS
jgi:hypothetical protein